MTWLDPVVVPVLVGVAIFFAQMELADKVVEYGSAVNVLLNVGLWFFRVLNLAVYMTFAGVCVLLLDDAAFATMRITLVVVLVAGIVGFGFGRYRDRKRRAQQLTAPSV